MKILNLVVIAGVSIAITGCSTIQSYNSQTTSKTHPKIKKNPMTVSFYPSTKNITLPYTVLGQEIISKYNFVGIKRQEATIHDAMRSKAAEMGGDAIVDIKHDDKTVTGTVIAYRSKFNV